MTSMTYSLRGRLGPLGRLGRLGRLRTLVPTPLLVLLALLAALLLAACGGGDETATPLNNPNVRPLSADFTTRKAVNYSPYRTSANVNELVNENITEAMVRQDLELMRAAGFGIIRTFDSSDKVAKLTLDTIFKFGIDMKVQLGAYVNNADEGGNQAELARMIALASQYRDIVIGVSVGNETMVEWSFNKFAPEVIGRYLQQVRAAVRQPVTTNDNFAFWASAPNVVTDHIDYVALHTYPELDTVFNPTLFNWKQESVAPAQRAAAMMDAAITEAKRQFQLARKHLDRKGLTALPIVIGETGWNAENVGRLAFRAHPVNQKMYVDRLLAWQAEGRAGNGPRTVFYFEAFDEPWKQGDDKWGLFNVAREARFVIQSLGTCGVTWACEAGSYTLADAVFFSSAVPGPAVTANRYTLYSEATAPGTEQTAGGLRWDAFDGFTVVAPEVNNDAAPNDGTRSLRLTTNPAPYGWGFLRQSGTGATDNLSGFANGHLVFSIKTTYAGKIEIGMGSDTVNRDGAEVFLQIGNGDYGYRNNGQWVQVSIPLRDFVAKNPKLDLSLIRSRFIIADRWEVTGNFARTGLPPLSLDGIYWQK